jgi:hypothetical protein
MSTPPRLFDTDALTDLIIQIREVSRLRELVRKAEILALRARRKPLRKEHAFRAKEAASVGGLRLITNPSFSETSESEGF